jgi:KaiC/GvpD/RAD55 family RecA-like ATPase
LSVRASRVNVVSKKRPNAGDDPDLLDQLLYPSVSTLLVKGTPGAGKSTFALELLRRNGKGAYVSTRVSKESLPFQNPQVSLVALRGAESEMSVGDVAVDSSDYRFAGAREIVTLVMDRATKQPGGLIVLDSWDSIAKELAPVERLRTEKTIVSVVQAQESRLAFISEEPDLTTTDYLVDAIIELSSEVSFGSILRKMEVKKLRGMPIRSPTSLYTLTNGRFYMLQPPKVLSPGQYTPKRFIRTPNNSDHYSTGVAGLDQSLGGGLTPGLTTALEFKRDFPADMLSPFLQAMAANLMSNGSGYVMLPSVGVSGRAFLESVSAFLPKELVDSKLRIGSYRRSDVATILNLDATEVEGTFAQVWKAIDELDKIGPLPSSILIGLDKLEAIHGPDKLQRHISKTISRVKSSKGTATFVVRENTTNKDSIVGMCDSHQIFDLKAEAIVVQSVKPIHGAYSVEYDYRPGWPQVNYLPIE